PGRADRRDLDRVGHQRLELARLLAGLDEADVFVRIEAVKGEQLARGGVLAAADRDDAHDLALHVLDRLDLGAGDEPEERAAQADRYGGERRAALDGADRAADRAESREVAGDAGGDRGIGRHLDELRLEALFLEVALLLGDEKFDRGDAA